MGGHDKQNDKRLSFLKEQAEISCTLGTGSQRDDTTQHRGAPCELRRVQQRCEGGGQQQQEPACLVDRHLLSRAAGIVVV